MRNNQKGFAITSFLYAILIVFLVVFTVLLMGLINSQLTLQKIKKDVRNKVEENSLVQNGEYVELVVSPKNIEIEAGEEINLLDGVYLVSYDNTKIDTTITYTSNPEFSNDVAGTYLITYTATYNGVLYSGIRNIIVNEDTTQPPEFTYTGEYEFIDEGEGSWRIKFKTNGTLTFTNLGNAKNGIDVFLVGGGGANGNTNNIADYSGSGGGGYTKTVSDVEVKENTTYDIVIGEGATRPTASNTQNQGGQTTAFNYTALGGYSGKGLEGGAGGSGGAAYQSTVGGSNGASGGYYSGTKGGDGQRTSTYEFAGTDGTLYAKGGYYGSGDGEANTGNGGGGTNSVSKTTKGGSGIVIIKNAKTKKIKSLPQFTYTGQYEIIDESNGNWKIKFLESGVLTLKSSATIDLFMCGGGGANGNTTNIADYSGSGGGGYTKTVKSIQLEKNSYEIVVGLGGTRPTVSNTQNQGDQTTAFNYTALGGYSGKGLEGGAGGSGGAAFQATVGGSNGANGGASTYNGGTGQGTTTKEFEEESGTLYATGGYNGSGNGKYNTCDGGGGTDSVIKVTQGGSGIVVIRNAR